MVKGQVKDPCLGVPGSPHAASHPLTIQNPNSSSKCSHAISKMVVAHPQTTFLMVMANSKGSFMKSIDK
jgi:hypothetical protein